MGAGDDPIERLAQRDLRRRRRCGAPRREEGERCDQGCRGDRGGQLSLVSLVSLVSLAPLSSLASPGAPAPEG
jgi:hypothetical protein